MLTFSNVHGLECLTVLQLSPNPSRPSFPPTPPPPPAPPPPPPHSPTPPHPQRHHCITHPNRYCQEQIKGRLLYHCCLSSLSYNGILYKPTECCLNVHRLMRMYSLYYCTFSFINRTLKSRLVLFVDVFPIPARTVFLCCIACLFQMGILFVPFLHARLY